MKSSIQIVLLSAWLLTSCNNQSETNNNQATETPTVFSYDTVKLASNKLPFSAVGEVSFDEDNVVRVYPIVSGSVETVNVSLGDYVNKGQLLSTLLSTDISQYQKEYNVSKSDLEIEKKQLARAKELYATNVISQVELEQAQKAYNNAFSEYSERMQILSLYGGSKDHLDAVFKMQAPISGYVVERNLNEGMQIRTDNSSSAFTISDLKTVWIWASVYESDLNKVKVGDSVAVKTIAYPDKVFYGKIKTVGTMLDPISRVIKVRIDLNNDDFLLKPEMFATVTIQPSIEGQSLFVSSKSVLFENNAYYVVKSLPNAKYEKVKIDVGETFADRVKILSGLKAGDVLVKNGALLMNSAINH